jgi:hypothetical protein
MTRDSEKITLTKVCQEHVCGYVCIYQIYIALISSSAHVHEHFNNIVSKNYGEKDDSLV